ncbi:MAG TPA: ATP-binding protein [Polyangiaceae bacterium]|nr:ATP-binding protein [Polyangiaceae bacterium]
MSDVHDDTDDRITKVLGKYMPERSARALISQARRITGIHHSDLEARDLSALFVALEKQAATLLDRWRGALLHGELEFELASSVSGIMAAAPIVPEAVEVRSEWDVSVARARSRELMTALEANSYEVVRVMTLVSELARNIVLYTPGGRIAFELWHDPRSLVVRATDNGPGIPNLSDVLAGRYRSKTGLGKGLLGVRRLSSRFTIHTDSAGTRIEAEVRL